MTGERSESALKHLRTLFNEGAVGGLTDGELLARFAGQGGEAAESAFAALVERHAPMVLMVCQQFLDLHDAQDASQATFLVLAKKARSIKRPEALGSWLHGVALRVAAKAKVAAARRRAHERRGGEMAARIESEWDRSEPHPEVHQEIDRLPEKFRVPVVLCYLEGLTHEQAAQRLGWPLGTVESRLARARDRLRQRLARRGVMPSAALLAARSLSEGATTAVSPAWIQATARSASQFAEGKAVAAVASANVAVLTEGTLKTMALTQLKVVLAYTLAAGLGATGVIAVLRAVSTPAPESQRAAARQPRPPVIEQSQPATEPLAPVTIKVSGRVLDPAGRPRAGSRLWLAFRGIGWTSSTRVPQVRATTGPDGHFAFSVSDADPEVSQVLRMTSGWPGGFGAIQVIASADGSGPAWTALGEIKSEIELRLTLDDIAIEGTLLTPEGLPIAGISVRTLSVEDPATSQRVFGAPSGFFQSATTDAHGRFILTGIGRARLATLGLLGRSIARATVSVATGPIPPRPPSRNLSVPYASARFEHFCMPGKSITGFVRDIDTGAPLPGITVVSDFGGSAMSTTDQNGRYRMDGLSKTQTRHMIASARGTDQPYVNSERTVEDSPEYEPMTVDFQMVRGVVVRGRLTDRATRRPIQAWVAYAAMRDNASWSRVPGFQKDFETNCNPNSHSNVPAMADGSFRLVALPGKGFLVASIQYQFDLFLPAGVPNKRTAGAPGDALDAQYDTVPFRLFPSNFPAVKPVDIAQGTESLTCDLTLDSGVVRTGTVHDPEGRPLSDTTIVGATLKNLNRFTATDGPNFTVYSLIPDPKRSRTVIFRHAEKGLGKTLRIDGVDRGPIEVRLEPMAALAGRLVDNTGKPRDEVELRLQVVSEPIVGAGGELSPPLRALTDADGRFRIDGIVPGATYCLVGPGAPLPNVELWTPKAGEVNDLGNIAPKAKK